MATTAVAIGDTATVDALNIREKTQRIEYFNTQLASLPRAFLAQSLTEDRLHTIPFHDIFLATKLE